VTVLADRLAAALVRHEPGWRLPRLTQLARRYSVSSSEIDAAVDELAARHLVSRHPDGLIYRTSPVEYWIPLEGIFGLTSHVDPMGGQITCASRQATMRRPPEEIGLSLGTPPGKPILTIRCLWTVGSEPAAVSASYLTERLASEIDISPASLDGQEDGLNDQGRVTLFPTEAFAFPWRPAKPGGLQPEAVQIEMGPPPSSAARRLRLAAGKPAAAVTVSFIDPATRSPTALTVAMLRLELFRVVVETATSRTSAGHTGDLPSPWQHLTDGQER
jgi:hypothetical protein